MKFDMTVDELINSDSSGLNMGTVEDYDIWYKMFKLSLRGMNIGGGAAVEDSGERWVMKYIANNIMTENGIVFDVGANIGKYANAVLKIMDVERHKISELHAFEPVHLTYKKLCSNVSDDRAVLNNFGLSDSKKEQIIYYDKDSSSLASVYKRQLDYKNIFMDKNEIIKLETLDGYCKSRNVEQIDFLKMDVEGNELNVLRGAKNMLDENRIKAIQFEFGGCNIDSRTYFKDFWNMLHEKYYIYRILKNGLHEMPKYSEFLEIFHYSNFLAVNKEIDNFDRK